MRSLKKHPLGVLAATWPLACGVVHGPAGDEFRAGPRPTYDETGLRRFTVETTTHRELCPVGTSCVTIDMNHDGKDDLVRIDCTGALGEPGGVDVAYSNGWDLGAMVPAYQGLGTSTDHCTVADVDGDGYGDLLRVSRLKGGVVAVRGGPEGFTAPELWSKVSCTMNQSCTFADVDADGRADFVLVDHGTGTVSVSRSLGKAFGTPQTWAKEICHAPGSCRFADMTGDRAADLVVLGSQKIAVVAFEPLPASSPSNPWSLPSTSWPGSLPGSLPGTSVFDDVSVWGTLPNLESLGTLGEVAGWNTSWMGPSCGDDHVCELRDVDADGLADVVRFSNDGGHEWWRNVGTAFELADSGILPRCKVGARCWLADITGDGRADTVSLSNGIVEVFPSQDALDRIDDHAMRLSMLASDHEQRRIEWGLRQTRWLLAEAHTVSEELLTLFPIVTPHPQSLQSLPPRNRHSHTRPFQAWSHGPNTSPELSTMTSFKLVSTSVGSSSSRKLRRCSRAFLQRGRYSRPRTNAGGRSRSARSSPRERPCSRLLWA